MTWDTEVEVTSKQAWEMLAKTWDEVVYPQLEDRYSGRTEPLLELLKVDTPPAGAFAWTLRTAVSGAGTTRALSPVTVSSLPLDVIERSFQWLVR